MRQELSRLGAVLRRKAALGLSPVTAPVMLFIPVGFVLGPLGAGALSSTVLARLDIVISIALATLGVFIGMAAGTGRGESRRLATASSVEAGITIVAVAAVAYSLLVRWAPGAGLAYHAIALVLGICASASAAPVVHDADGGAGRIAARVADLDDVLPIVLGCGVVAMVAAPGRSPMAITVLAAGAGLLAGLIGWLLFERTEGPERDVFVLGTLALLGGSAAYIGASPLLAGFAAGWLWAVTPGHADRLIAGQLHKLQHPLIVLLLVIGGALASPSLLGVWLFAAYVLARLVGKLLGGWAGSRIAPAGVAPADLGAYLLAPGVIGVAFALNVAQVVPEDAGPIVFAVAAGAIASEGLALLVAPAVRGRG